jgi:hypothetical protein
LATEVETTKPEVTVVLVVGVGILRHLQADDMAVATLYAENTAGFAIARFAKRGAAFVQTGSTNLRSISYGGFEYGRAPPTYTIDVVVAVIV